MPGSFLRIALFILSCSALLIGCGGSGGNSSTGGGNQQSKANNFSTQASSKPNVSSSISTELSSLAYSASSRSLNPIFPIPDSYWSAPPTAVSTTGNYVYLEEDGADGVTKKQLFTPETTGVYLWTFISQVNIGVYGQERSFGYFRLPHQLSRFEPGVYQKHLYTSNQNETPDFFSWRPHGAPQCVNADWIIVDAVNYDSRGNLTELNLRFEGKCLGAEFGLRGQIHWRRDHIPNPANPVSPAPDWLWRPDQSFERPNMNYVYLTSSGPSDFIGQGQQHLYTQTNAKISVDNNPGVLTQGVLNISITGDKSWTGKFITMKTLSKLEPGFYGNINGVWADVLQERIGGELDWHGDGRGCNTNAGWFAIDSVDYEGENLIAIDLRFEQHCEGNTEKLSGVIHWRADDATPPPLPIYPIPADLWAPMPNTTPASGNYVYFESSPGDWVGQGQTATLTPYDNLFEVKSRNLTFDVGLRGVEMNVVGDTDYSGTFLGMSTLVRLEVGYYGGGLNTIGSANPAKGALSWTGDSRGCNQANSWFAVDDISYDENGDVTLLDLRFSQTCESQPKPLHGKIHWQANDQSVTAPGPQSPPAGLWIPSAAPATGNYVVLESQGHSHIGDGKNYTFTDLDVTHFVDPYGQLFIYITGGPRDGSGFWSNFRPMASLSRLEAGYYGAINESNPVKGHFEISLGSRAGATRNSWFVVDKISYDSDGNLTSIDIRFEHHSLVSSNPLFGKIHWVKP